MKFELLTGCQGHADAQLNGDARQGRPPSGGA